MLQNANLLAKIGADTAENERNVAELLPTLATTPRVHYPRPRDPLGQLGRLERHGPAAAGGLRFPRVAREAAAGLLCSAKLQRPNKFLRIKQLQSAESIDEI